MTRNTKKIMSLISLLVLMAVMALGMISCGKNTPADTTADTATQTEEVKGVTVTVEITDDKGEKTSKEYTTEAVTLADLLLGEKLVEGDNTDYGLMITTVNGIKADYNADGAYWALYKNGEYMQTGADGETLTDGAVYGLVYTKG